MPKGKEKQVEQPVEQPKVETPEAQAETPTVEIDWKAEAERLKAEAEVAKETAEHWEKSYKGQQKVISRKDEQLRKKGTITAPPATSQLEALKLMVGELEETGGATPRIAEIKRAIVAEEGRIAQEQYTQWQQSVIDEHSEEIESSLSEVGIDWDSDDAKGVRDAFEKCSKTGDFSRAYFKLSQAINKGKKQAEPEDNEKKEQELKRKVMDEAGLLETVTGSPSGGKPIFTPSQIAARKVYEAHREEILAARKEGRIKIEE